MPTNRVSLFPGEVSECCFNAINAVSPWVEAASNDLHKNVKKCILSAATLRVNDSWSL